jgi:hypothetical protein
VPSIQRTVAFEKASVLFNLAALHTQIGSKQDRQSSSDTADAAVDNFLRAAGTLRYIGEHFTHPPSFDLAPHTLDALTALFLVCRKVNPVAVVCIFFTKMRWMFLLFSSTLCNLFVHILLLYYTLISVKKFSIFNITLRDKIVPVNFFDFGQIINLKVDC